MRSAMCSLALSPCQRAELALRRKKRRLREIPTHPPAAKPTSGWGGGHQLEKPTIRFAPASTAARSVSLARCEYRIVLL